jgi:programmed cell death protein 5
MDDLEAARQRRLQELQARAAQNQVAQQQAAVDAQRQAEAMDQALAQILEPEARNRMTLIRMSRPELADAVSRQLVQLAQQGRIQRALTDADLKQILSGATPQERDIKITRK